MASGEFANINLLPDGWTIDYQSSASSSNDLAFACLKQNSGQAEGRCFLVGEQTKGRGRRGKNWVSRPGDGLYLSVILCPDGPRHIWPSLSFVASLGVLKALSMTVEQQHRSACRLKWPNDILFQNRKLAGILLEANEEGLVVGCGVNLQNAPVLDGVTHPAVALDELITGGEVEAKSLACSIVSELGKYYAVWQSEGHQIILDEWRQHCDMKGKAVRIQTMETVIEGICEDIGADGALCVRDAGGQRLQITAGDVEIMRGRNASGD